MRSLRNFFLPLARRTLAGASVMAVAACLGSTAFAGIFTNDTVNQISDADHEAAYRNEGGVYTLLTPGQTLQQGDYLVSTVGFGQAGDNLNGSNQYPQTLGNNELTAVSLIQILSDPTQGQYQAGGVTAANFTFQAASLAAWTAIVGSTPAYAGTISSLYENSKGSISDSGLGSPSGIPTDIHNVTTGTLLWNFGFTGNAVTAANDQGNALLIGGTLANGSIGEGWVASGPVNPADITSSNAKDWTYNSAMTMLLTAPGAPELNTQQKVGFGYDNTPAGPAQGQFDNTGTLLNSYTYANGASGGGSGVGVRTDFQLQGNLRPGSGDFPVGSSSDAFLNIAPEPSSLLLMGLGFASFAGARLRRRRATMAA